VARSIAQEINVKLTSQEAAHLASTRPVDPAVYELYLRGRHLCNTFVEEEWYRGIDQFKQALKHDSSYAPAYAGLARCYSNLALIAYLSPADAFSAAEAAVSKALELDESLGEAHASRGYMKLLFKWDWSGAKRDLQRALELEPNNVGILLYYGHYLTMTNQNDEARKAYDRAMELDPLSPTTALWRAWGAGFITRRYDQSIRQLERILELEPQYTHVHMWLAVNYVKKGMYAEAFAKAKEVEAIAPESEDQGFLGVLGWIYGAVGQRDDALRILQQLQGLAPRRWLDPFFVAVIHTGLEDKDNAFQWLRKAYEERSPSLVLFINHPMADNIRSDPRFGKLMKDMGFESG
jgi:tetratricopeptide (TPR) repeat protein